MQINLPEVLTSIMDEATDLVAVVETSDGTVRVELPARFSLDTDELRDLEKRTGGQLIGIDVRNHGRTSLRLFVRSWAKVTVMEDLTTPSVLPREYAAGEHLEDGEVARVEIMSGASYLEHMQP